MIAFTKRIFFITTVVLFNLSCTTDNQPDETDDNPIEEDIIFIPDENFRNTLLNEDCIDSNNDLIPDRNIDLNNDDKIQRSEAENVEALILDFEYGAPIKFVDLEGIENFINIKYLDISGTGGDETNFDQVINTENISYDFRNLEKLENLSIEYLATEHFDNIDLSGLSELTTLDLSQNRPINYEGDYENQLINLDLNGCSNLKELNITNSFFSIYFCQIPSLEKLNMEYLEGGEPDPFDFHCLTNLKWLNIAENQVETLILKNSSVLETFIYKTTGSEGWFYPFPNTICIDNNQVERDQIAPLVGENTNVISDCTF